MIDASDVLKVKYINHDIRAIDDTVPVKRLTVERIALTACPLSNEKLKVYLDPCNHSLR